LDIPRLIEQVCDRYQAQNSPQPTLEDILAADQWARQAVLAASQTLAPNMVGVS
jgi:1-deoxy-D-xylulose-5-phosphate reductoisomerase